MASVVVLAVAVMFYCFRQTPVYEVTSVVYIQDNKGDNSNILLESLGLSSYKKNIDNEIEVLRSKIRLQMSSKLLICTRLILGILFEKCSIV